jgi:DNA-binding IclR family transcriptional regulator
MTPGTSAIAVPILDMEDRAVAALGLVTRTVRRDIVKFVPALRVASATISRRLAQHRPD